MCKQKVYLDMAVQGGGGERGRRRQDSACVYTSYMVSLVQHHAQGTAVGLRRAFKVVFELPTTKASTRAQCPPSSLCPSNRFYNEAFALLSRLLEFIG